MKTNKQYLLDASALLALMKDEPGANIVEEHMADSFICSVNLSEVITVLSDQGYYYDDIIKINNRMCPHVIDYTEKHAYISGLIRKDTKKFGLSLGDRACLAVTIDAHLIALTSDKIWKNIDIKNLKIKCIR